MAVDYFVQYPCKVREQLSDQQLLQMIKSRARAMVALEAMRSNPKLDLNKPESEWTIVLRTQGPNGVEDRPVKLYDLLAQARPLDKLALHCKDCP